MVPKMRPLKNPKRISLVLLLRYKFTKQILYPFISLKNNRCPHPEVPKEIPGLCVHVVLQDGVSLDLKSEEQRVGSLADGVSSIEFATR